MLLKLAKRIFFSVLSLSGEIPDAKPTDREKNEMSNYKVFFSKNYFILNGLICYGKNRVVKQYYRNSMTASRYKYFLITSK